MWDGGTWVGVVLFYRCYSESKALVFLRSHGEGTCGTNVHLLPTPLMP